MDDLPALPQPEIENPAEAAILRCPNCNKKQKKSFKYCPKCGQRNTSHKVSVKILLSDLFREELHLNNKTIRTLKLLFLQPGALTLAYISGKKKSMLTPTKLFVWSGFLLIAMILPTIKSLEIDPDNGPIRFNIGPIDGGEGSDSSSVNSDQISPIAEFFTTSVEEANENPKLYIEKTLRRFPFVLLTILPVFAFFLKLIYFRRKMYYLEHMVFLLHFHSFMFILSSVLLAITLLIPAFGIGKQIGAMISFLYVLLAYRKVYVHSWPGTIFKGGLIGLVYIITVPIVLILISLVISLIF